jgi:hypothetical protein
VRPASLLMMAALASAADLSRLKPLLRDVQWKARQFERTRGASPNFPQIMISTAISAAGTSVR